VPNATFPSNIKNGIIYLPPVKGIIYLPPEFGALLDAAALNVFIVLGLITIVM
jgi:hypothetical protein